MKRFKRKILRVGMVVHRDCAMLPPRKDICAPDHPGDFCPWQGLPQGIQPTSPTKAASSAYHLGEHDEWLGSSSDVNLKRETDTSFPRDAVITPATSGSCKLVVVWGQGWASLWGEKAGKLATSARWSKPGLKNIIKSFWNSSSFFSNT